MEVEKQQGSVTEQGILVASIIDVTIAQWQVPTNYISFILYCIHLELRYCIFHILSHT